MTLIDQLILHEGLRLKLYFDPLGVPTLGVGRNLRDTGITHEEAMYLLKNDVARVLTALENGMPFFPRLSELRQRVLIDMAINLGPAGVLSFYRMVDALGDGDYQQAAREMLASKWAHQVKGRAVRLASWMETGIETA